MSPLKLKNGRLHIGKHKIRIYLKDSASQWRAFIKWSLLSLLVIILGILIFSHQEYFLKTEMSHATQTSCPKQPCPPSGQEQRSIVTNVPSKIYSEVSTEQRPTDLPPSWSQKPIDEKEGSISQHIGPIVSSAKPDVSVKQEQASSPTQTKNPIETQGQEVSLSQKEMMLITKLEEALKIHRIDEVKQYLTELKSMNPLDLNKLLSTSKSDVLTGVNDLYRKQIELSLIKNELGQAKNLVQEWKNFIPHSSIQLEFLNRIEGIESFQQCNKKSPKTGYLKEPMILECYKKVLQHYPNTDEAKAGIESLYQKRVEQVLKEKEVTEKGLGKAQKIIQDWKTFNSDSPILSQISKRVETIERLQRCRKIFQAGHLFGDPSAFSCYDQVLSQDPSNKEAQAEIDHLYSKQVEQALAKNDLEQARNLMQAWKKKFTPQSPIFSRFLEQIKSVELSQQCRQMLQAGRFVGKRSALECYKKVLRQDPENKEGHLGMKEIEMSLQNQVEEVLDLAQETSDKKYLHRARKLLQNMEKLFPDSLVLPTLKRRLDESSQQPIAEKKSDLLRTDKHEQRIVETKSNLPHEHKQVVIETKPPSLSQETKKLVSTPPTEGNKPILNSSSSSKSEKSVVVLPSRCTEIFVQESLGLQALTPEQKEFKKTNCNPKLKN